MKLTDLIEERSKKYPPHVSEWDKACIDSDNESLATSMTLAYEAGQKAERERILGKQELPDRLRETRLHLGLSQEEVGKRLGYSAMAISHFEKGNRPIPEKVLGEFIMIFGSLVETQAGNRRGKALTPPTTEDLSGKTEV